METVPQVQRMDWRCYHGRNRQHCNQSSSHGSGITSTKRSLEVVSSAQSTAVYQSSAHGHGIASAKEGMEWNGITITEDGMDWYQDCNESNFSVQQSRIWYYKRKERTGIGINSAKQSNTPTSQAVKVALYFHQITSRKLEKK